MVLSVKLNPATGTTQGKPLGGASAQACRYVWGPDIGSRPFARRDWQAAGGVRGLVYAKYLTGPNANKLHIPVTDAMGNVTSVHLIYTNGSASYTQRTDFVYDYDAFGKETRSSTLVAGLNPDSFPFHYSTKFTDGETGLNYYGYRFYDPANGRWPSRDPIEEQGGVNLYGMVGNDGVNWLDVLGLQAPRKEYNTPEEAIDECGKKAKEKAEDDCKKRKKSNADAEAKAKKEGSMLPRLPATKEREWGGQVCKSKNSTPENPKYYCTEQKEGDASSIDPTKTTPCDKGDSYEGFYHSHPDNTALSPKDIRSHVHGWGDTVPEAKTRAGKPVGATRRVGGEPGDPKSRLVTDIIPWPRNASTINEQ
jgi:RHS repeat-associated protein